MSRFLTRGVVAALAIGVSTPMFAAEPPATATDSRPWYKKLFVSADASRTCTAQRAGDRPRDAATDHEQTAHARGGSSERESRKRKRPCAEWKSATSCGKSRSIRTMKP